MTNLEKIRQMSAEEIESYLNLICENARTCERCFMYRSFCKDQKMSFFMYEKKFTDWLNEEAKE